MSSTVKTRFWRVFLHGAVLIILYILQAMVAPHIRLFGVAPLILPVAVVGVALFAGPAWGGGFGLAAGILMDTAQFGSTILFTFTLFATGLFLGLFSTYLLNRRGFPYLLCTLGVLMLIGGVQAFPILVFDQVPFAPVFTRLILQTGYSILFALPFYGILVRLNKRYRTTFFSRGETRTIGTPH